MELVGYIKGSKIIGFAVPIYSDGLQFFTHTQSHFRIQGFIIIRIKNSDFIPINNHLQFRKSGFIALIFFHNEKIIFGRSDEVIIIIREYINFMGINISALNKEIKHIQIGIDWITFDIVKLSYSIEIIRAVAHPIRMKILGFIDRNGYINVNSIYKAFKLERLKISHHLRILTNVDVLKMRKEGKLVLYHINYNLLYRVERAVNIFVGKLPNETGNEDSIPKNKLKNKKNK